MIDNISQLIEQINQAANQQKQFTDNMSDNINHIDQVALQSVNSANTMTKISDSVAELAEELSQLVSRFKC